MKSPFLILSMLLVSATFCFGQYDRGGLVITAGANYSKYLGTGIGDNYFQVDKPGIQAELTANFGQGFEWVMWGFSYYEALNVVGNSEVPVKFTSPYYTEFIFYKKEKKNPLFIFLGFDVVKMKFPEMEEADYHYNISLGGGWNLRLTDRIYMQFKVKPFYIIDNSIGQKFGVNTMINLHFRTGKSEE